MAWCFYLGFGGFAIYLEVLHYTWRTLLFVLVWCFGDLHYDALALALLHLEEINIGEPCLGVAIFGGFGGV